MNISNAEKIVRGSTSNHDRVVVYSPGRSQGAASQGCMGRNESISERRRGSYANWSEDGNHAHLARVLSPKEAHARDEATREEISRRRSNGETLAQLAKRFHSSRGRISRILAQQ